jgi:hypothetical protein
MSEEMYSLTISLPLLAVTLIFIMKYVAAILQARARQASDEAYRELADRAVAAQEETRKTLVAVQATLSELRQRTASVETILKQVE